MKILIILLIICIIIYFKINSNNIETFYTFFKPYYSNEKNYNYDLYTKKLYNNIAFENKFNYKPLIIASNKTKNNFLELITKIILEKSQILHINYLYYDNYYKMLHDLNDNKVQLINTSYPIFDHIHNIPNVRYVCTTDIKYIYICKRSDNYALKNFSYIHRNTKIGILKEDESYIFVKMVTDFIGLKENKDYKIKIYETEDHLLDDLNNNKIAIAVFNDTYPPQVFKKYHNMELMELNGFRSNIFFEQYKQYFSRQIIDLNNMGSQYLPKSYDTKTYTMFNPDFEIVSFETFILTNTSVTDENIEDILKSINNSIPLLNRLPQYRKASIKYNSSIMNKVVYGLLPSNGTLKYLNKYGYISDIDNANCKYFIGKDKCTEENLALLT